MQQLQAEGHSPKALQERTEVREDLKIYWEAFTVLNESRQMSMGIAPIPLTEIKAYLGIYQEDDPGLFIDLVRAMDGVYLEHAKSGKKNKAAD